MPELIDYVKIPVPLDEEANTTPADMKRAFNTVKSQFVLRAKHLADAQDKYTDVDDGAVCACTDEDDVIYKHDGKWRSLTKPKIESFTELSWATNFEERGNGSTIIRLINNTWVELYLSARYQGEDVQADENGRMADYSIAKIPNRLRPAVGGAVITVFGGNIFTGFGFVYSSSGNANITDGLPNNTLETGTAVTVSATWTV